MNAPDMKGGCFLTGKSDSTRGLTTLWRSLIGVMLICASTQVAAQICEAERQAARSANLSGFGNLESMNSGNLDKFLLEQATQRSFSQQMPDPAFQGLRIGGKFPDILTNVKGLRVWAESGQVNARQLRMAGAGRGEPEFSLFTRCLVLYKIAQLERGSPLASSASASSAGSTNRPSATNPAASGSSATSGQATVRDAIALAQKRQTDADRARQGKPKRHVAGTEANHCLTLVKGGGVTNQCPYAVEYLYCVYRPHKDSWSAGLDCEKPNFGLWHIGPGPGSRSIMQSEGEMTYWFACKYGATISKPDGIGVADTHFERGRGIYGRCAEWGSRQG